jgi:hypothetical protein
VLGHAAVQACRGPLSCGAAGMADDDRLIWCSICWVDLGGLLLNGGGHQ